jgi:hypothetical protein
MWLEDGAYRGFGMKSCATMVAFARRQTSCQE